MQRVKVETKKELDWNMLAMALTSAEERSLNWKLLAGALDSAVKASSVNWAVLREIVQNDRVDASAFWSLQDLVRLMKGA